MRGLQVLSLLHQLETETRGLHLGQRIAAMLEHRGAGVLRWALCPKCTVKGRQTRSWQRHSQLIARSGVKEIASSWDSGAAPSSHILSTEEQVKGSCLNCPGGAVRQRRRFRGCCY